jgi:hypothetical protein
MGTIHYPEGETGYLFYLKASLTGDEPEDVREFRSRFADFPHQSTGDQFFTESQFESYRHLGLHMARTALQHIPQGTPVGEVFAQLNRTWGRP